VVGNRVTKQFQLDALGEALQLFAAAGEAGRLDADAEHAMEAAVAAIGRRWRDPEAGMWELEDRFWTQSRLSCVAGLRAAARYRRGRQAAAWLELADAVLAETTRRCLAPAGRWQRAADDPRLDAGLLLAPIRGALPPADPRSQATLAGYLSGLTEDGYAYRFRQDSRPLHAAEGAFLFCGYIVALALQQQGDTVAAARWFERNRAACGPPGLFSEEFDVEQRQLRGNLPQAFVHAIMLETSVRLAPALSHR
jgi:GH15 family glucan-1,4-alpha-glucosidase